MATKTRNRVIYQSEALYVGQPSATGVHINAIINEDDASKDLSDRIFGLIKDPSDLEDICILDWKDYWTPISAPVDLVDGSGNPVAPYKGAYAPGDDYKKDDVVDIEMTSGTKIYFEAQSDVEQNGDTYRLDSGVAGNWAAKDYSAGDTVRVDNGGSDDFYKASQDIDLVSTDDFNVFFASNPDGYQAGQFTKADDGEYYEFSSDFIGVVADADVVAKATAAGQYIKIEGGNFYVSDDVTETSVNGGNWSDTGFDAFADSGYGCIIQQLHRPGQRDVALGSSDGSLYIQ